MLTLSKNTFSFTPDAKRINRHITVNSEQVIGSGTTHAIMTLPFLTTDDIYHAAISVACSFPLSGVGNHPTISATCTSGSPMGVETLNCTTTTARVGFLRAAVDVSSTTPYTEIQINLTAGSSNFTIPIGSIIGVSIEPNEALLSSSVMPSPPPVQLAISYGITVPVNNGIPAEIQGDYRRFQYSFDKTGTPITHKVVGMYEKSVNDGSKITVNVAMLFRSDGWDVWSIFKREYSGAEYQSSLAIHNNGTGHEDYSSGFDFVSSNEWIERSGNQYFRAYNSFSDGSGFCPKLYHTGDIPLSTIQP